MTIIMEMRITIAMAILVLKTTSSFLNWAKESGFNHFDNYVGDDDENCNHNETYLDDFDNYEEGERKRDDDEEEREDCEETGAHPGTLVTS